jgi:hypothetical protein
LDDLVESTLLAGEKSKKMDILGIQLEYRQLGDSGSAAVYTMEWPGQSVVY